MTVWAYTPTRIPIVPLPRLDEAGLITAEMLPHLDVGRGELIKGVFVEMPPPGFTHGRVEGNAYNVLRSYEDMMGSGKAFVGETGVKTAENPDTVRGTDALFISHERFAQNRSEQYIDVPPELIVEVLSPSDRWRMVNDKINEYFDMGVDLVWVIDPKAKEVRVYTSSTDFKILKEGDMLSAEPHLPNFSTPVTALFA